MSHIVVSHAGVVCGRMTTALSARRPCAGSVPGRWGACLAVRTPPAAFPSQYSPVRTRHFASRWRHGGPPGVTADARGQRADAPVGRHRAGGVEPLTGAAESAAAPPE